MRHILRKITKGLSLSNIEEENLLSYCQNLRYKSPESYLVFYEQYRQRLFQKQHILIPNLDFGLDDIIDYLLQNQKYIALIKQEYFSEEFFPLYLRKYVHILMNEPKHYSFLLSIINEINNLDISLRELPQARKKNVVIKFEDANINKEIGLKHHFERIARYSFVNRIQSYRYLSSNKANQDRIDYYSPDCLKGVFTNKDKSIMYYIFLSEHDEIKAINACHILNMSLSAKS